MGTLRIALLGPTSITMDDRAEPLLLAGKPLALLAYLAVESDRPHRRDALAGLLWPEQPEERARHSLRQALVTVRAALERAGDGQCLAVTRQTLGLRPACDVMVDVIACQDALAAAEQHQHPRGELCPACAGLLQLAVDHYRGEFLTEPLGIESEAFEEWARHQRERLHQRILTALGRLADERERQDDLAGAVQLVRRQLELDPWREPAYRCLMELLMRAGDRTGAMAVYARCVQVLRDELGIGPEAETTALHERILRAGSGRAWQGHDVAPPETNLPVPATALVGRERELREITALLTTPECRLLTLIGPGGIGKTRLVLEVARARLARYRDGVRFVRAETVRDRRQLVAAIADAAGVPLSGGDDPETQLVRQLGDRELLLVLDSLEHLPGSGALVAGLLAAVPRVSVLVTSRARLNIAGEWVYELRGLPMPDDAAAMDAGAPALFLQIARRVAGAGPLDRAGTEALLRVCRLVEGTPLALIMAAGWAPVLSLPEIAAEIASGVDFLATAAPDVPERHRSMRVVCDGSWELLTPDEREVYRRLSVFRGGFDREAAAEVAGATLPVLAALVAKSFLRRQPGGRYGSHELLRQYGEERLSAEPALRDAVHDRHCAWFAGFVERREMRLASHQQVAALAEIGADIENVRAAWQWAVRRGRAAEISQFAHGLWLYHVIRGRMAEGDTLFGDAAVALAQRVAGGVDDAMTRRALATSLVRQGGFRSGLGHYAQARELLEAGIAQLRELGEARELGLALNFLAAIRHLAGNDAEERALLDESRALLTRVGDRWALGYTLSDLGMVALGRGDLPAARESAEQSRAIFLALGDRRGLAFACQHLGEIAAAGGDLAGAQRWHAESLRLRRLADDQWGVITSLLALGSVAREAGELSVARRHLTAALDAGAGVQMWPVLLDVLVELALLMAREGRPRAARAIVAPVLAHPSCNERLRAKAARLAPLLADQHAMSAGEATGRVVRLAESLRRGAPPAGLGLAPTGA